MSSRHRPTNGADSLEGWQPTPWTVYMADRYDPDYRFFVRIPAAIGRHDAENQAREQHPEGSPLRAYPVPKA